MTASPTLTSWLAQLKWTSTALKLTAQQNLCLEKGTGRFELNLDVIRF